MPVRPAVTARFKYRRPVPATPSTGLALRPPGAGPAALSGNWQPLRVSLDHDHAAAASRPTDHVVLMITQRHEVTVWSLTAATLPGSYTMTCNTVTSLCYKLAPRLLKISASAGITAAVTLVSATRPPGRPPPPGPSH